VDGGDLCSERSATSTKDLKLNVNTLSDRLPQNLQTIRRRFRVRVSFWIAAQKPTQARDRLLGTPQMTSRDKYLGTPGKLFSEGFVPQQKGNLSSLGLRGPGIYTKLLVAVQGFPTSQMENQNLPSPSMRFHDLPNQAREFPRFPSMTFRGLPYPLMAFHGLYSRFPRHQLFFPTLFVFPHHLLWLYSAQNQG